MMEAEVRIRPFTLPILLSLQVEGDVLHVIDIYIGQRDVDTSVLVFGGGSAYHRYFSASAHFGLSQIKSIGRKVASWCTLYIWKT